jgi:hypothetical protein
MKDSGRRWLIAAVGLFLFLLVGWVLLALQLNSALAGPLPFGPGLMSKLSADYRADEGGRSVALISLSILNDAMEALGLTEDEAAAAHESMELAMSQPVPTATAMDFDGAAPFTATPTITRTPRPTNTQSPTPTNTHRPPTRTPEPTETDKPTKTPGAPTATGAAPTATGSVPSATPGGDTQEPSFQSIVLDPEPPDNEGQCELDVTVEVFDPAFSSGIGPSDVLVRISINGGSPQNYGTLGYDSGGFVAGLGSDWLATYRGEVDLDDAKTDDTVLVEVKVHDIDNPSDWVIVPAGTYTMGCDCD